VDEHAVHPSPEEEQQDDDAGEERFERGLTQRELVRASLLRCPPADPAEHPPP
jgi:hypothetical protein